MPPEYEPQNWRNQKANCYLYALNARGFQNPEAIGICMPGCLIGKIQPPIVMSVKDIIYRMMLDLSRLNREMIPCDNPFSLPVDGYHIAIFVARNGQDLHFRRQDADGGWSEKLGWEGQVRRVSEKELTTYSVRGVGVYDLICYATIIKNEEGAP